VSRFICCYNECRYAECHYAECRYAECHGAREKERKIDEEIIFHNNETVNNSIKHTRDKHSSLFFQSHCEGKMFGTLTSKITQPFVNLVMYKGSSLF
jgi:hypothetical protein